VGYKESGFFSVINILIKSWWSCYET